MRRRTHPHDTHATLYYALPDEREALRDALEAGAVRSALRELAESWRRVAKHGVGEEADRASWALGALREALEDTGALDG